jgi:hypothetical protein
LGFTATSLSQLSGQVKELVESRQLRKEEDNCNYYIALVVFCLNNKRDFGGLVKV